LSDIGILRPKTAENDIKTTIFIFKMKEDVFYIKNIKRKELKEINSLKSYFRYSPFFFWK
jgi:hypothetical protein